MRNCLILFLICCMAGSLFASFIPADGDSWTEFATSSEATDAGWSAANNTASNDHSIAASSDAVVGNYSVAIEANAGATSWQYAGLTYTDTVDISQATGLSLYWKGAGNTIGESFFIRITMSRDAGGTKAVYKSFVMPSEWTEMSFTVEEMAGTWTWYNQDNKVWTNLDNIVIYTGSGLAASQGDAILVDGLHFVPEPCTIMLLGGAGAVAVYRRTRRS